MKFVTFAAIAPAALLLCSCDKVVNLAESAKGKVQAIADGIQLPSSSSEDVKVYYNEMLVQQDEILTTLESVHTLKDGDQCVGKLQQVAINIEDIFFRMGQHLGSDTQTSDILKGATADSADNKISIADKNYKQSRAVFEELSRVKLVISNDSFLVANLDNTIKRIETAPESGLKRASAQTANPNAPNTAGQAGPGESIQSLNDDWLPAGVERE